MIIGTDTVVMPVDLVVRPAERIVIVGRRSALDALLDAELRGAPDHELRLLEEGAIAASITRVRAALREGDAVSADERARFERDRELLRRFPEDRRGPTGSDWFHLR